MSLCDYKGGNFFKPGDYKVRVKSTKDIHFNSGNDGFEAVFSDGSREIKGAFVYTEKAYWKIAQLAEACGMEEKMMRTIEPDGAPLRKWLLNKECMIVVVKGPPKNGKSYSEIDEYYAVGGQARPAPATEEMPPIAEEAPTGDDVPF